MPLGPSTRMRPLPLAAFLTVLSVLSVGFGGLGIAEEAHPADSAPEARDQDSSGMPLWGSARIGDLVPAKGLRFGIDAGSIERFRERSGVAPDYATVWVGKWNLDSGWKGTDEVLAAIRQQGVTPAVHFYYWGDHISKDCLAYGCHGKDVFLWQRLAEELVEHLHATLQGGEAVVILESEFNKHGVHEDETLDQMLAEKAHFIRQGYPGAKLVLGLGNWYPDAWDTWDQAAAAVDYVGLQALGGATKDPEHEVLSLFNSTLDGAKRLRQMYGKPVFVQDVAVSSYPEPENLELQEEALARFALGLPDLQAAGVEAVVYRSFLDVPDMALSNHYVEAERHWGLAWHDTGELKPAGQVWLAAIQKARDLPVDLGS
jgi:hypothetical protein